MKKQLRSSEVSHSRSLISGVVKYLADESKNIFAPYQQKLLSCKVKNLYFGFSILMTIQ